MRHTGGRPLLGYAVQESNWRRLLGRPSRRGIDLTDCIASRAGLSVAPTRRLRPSGACLATVRPTPHPHWGITTLRVSRSPLSSALPTASQRSALPRERCPEGVAPSGMSALVISHFADERVEVVEVVEGVGDVGVGECGRDGWQSALCHRVGDLQDAPGIDETVLSCFCVVAPRSASRVVTAMPRWRVPLLSPETQSHIRAN